MTVRIFIHGLESGNQGTKSVYFRQRYPDMIIPLFTGSLEQRMGILNRILSGKSKLKIVGSSFGGLMATLYAMDHPQEVEKMILLAPAIHLSELEAYTDKIVSFPVWIYHGKADPVIPLEAVEPVARQIFSNLCFCAVDDDHFLHQTFKGIDWHRLLA